MADNSSANRDQPLQPPTMPAVQTSQPTPSLSLVQPLMAQPSISQTVPVSTNPDTLAILAAINTESTKNENRISAVRSDLRQCLDSVNSRVDDVEQNVIAQGMAIVETNERVSIVEKQAKHTAEEVRSHDQRIVALEEARANAGSHAVAPLLQSHQEFLMNEFANIRALMNEARALSRVAVVGCHGRKEPTHQAIINLISSEASLAIARFDIRGLVARITFDYDGENAGPVRAQRFVENVNSRQAGAVFWANVDEPRTLRDLRARARSFGAAVADCCACKMSELPRTAIVNGFVIVGDVVVGPLTMIPGEARRDEAVQKVKQVLLATSHASVDYKEALEHQLRRSITRALAAAMSRPEFVDGLSGPGDVRQQVTKSQLSAALLAAAKNQEKGGFSLNFLHPAPSIDTRTENPEDKHEAGAGGTNGEEQVEPLNLAAEEADNSTEMNEQSDNGEGDLQSESQLSGSSSGSSDVETVNPTPAPQKKRKKLAKTKPKKKPAAKKPVKTDNEKRGVKRKNNSTTEDFSSTSEAADFVPLLGDSVPKRVRRTKAGIVPIT